MSSADVFFRIRVCGKISNCFAQELVSQAVHGTLNCSSPSQTGSGGEGQGQLIKKQAGYGRYLSVMTLTLTQVRRTSNLSGAIEMFDYNY